MNTFTRGFTLIEMIVFIVVLSFIGVTLSTTMVLALRYSSATHNQTLATTSATACMEYLLGQRYMSADGYLFNDISQVCPGGNNYTSTNITFCNNLNPSGFTTTVNISCATVSGFTGTQAFKLVEVIVSGNGEAKVRQLIADY